MLLSAPPLPGWCLRGPQLAERCIVQRQHSSPWRDRGHTWLSNVGEGRHPADCRLWCSTREISKTGFTTAVISKHHKQLAPNYRSGQDRANRSPFYQHAFHRPHKKQNSVLATSRQGLTNGKVEMFLQPPDSAPQSRLLEIAAFCWRRNL